jgi:tetratricopeptide (TPR) repeat protein
VQNPNVKRYESLIDAELADLAGDSHLAIKHYKTAILLAGRRGFTNDEALTHERFGEHALRLGDSNDALYHFERAIELYQEWGAHAKVVQLRSAHGGLPSASD